MNFFAFALLFTAFCALCPATKSHAGSYSPKTGNHARMFKIIGWILLLLSVLAITRTHGLSIGIALWFGLASLGAGLTMLLRAYKPELLPKAALLIFVCTLCITIFSRLV